MASLDPSTPTLATYAGAWSLDPAGTSIEFHTKAMWVLNVKGTAKALSGAGRVGDDGSVGGELVIDVTSVDTKNAKRDRHLQTADFFDAATYPTMELAVTSAQLTSAGRAELAGTLSLHGQTRPITVPASVTATSDAVTIDAEVEIDRSEWGLAWAKMGAGLHNRVVVKARFTKD